MSYPLRLLVPALTALLIAGCSSNNNANKTSALSTLPAASSAGSAAAAGQPQPAAGTGQPIDGIPCEASETLTYHVHAHLALIANGQTVAVPANIGIPGRCIYWLHTHDASGVIHVEAPSPRDFTLGNFFDIWRQPLSSTQVLSFKADAAHSFQYFVNSQQYTGDPRQIPLGAHTLITIEYGPPFSQPPPYTFPSGL